jgi:hypothetical protein
MIDIVKNLIREVVRRVIQEVTKRVGKRGMGIIAQGVPERTIKPLRTQMKR